MEAGAEVEAGVEVLFVQDGDHSKVTQKNLKGEQRQQAAAAEDRAQLQGLLMGL